MAITIDTHAAIRELEAAGADSRLAEAIVATISRSDADLVSKADLAALEARLTARFTGLAYRLAFTLFVANTATTFGLLKLLLPAA